MGPLIKKGPSPSMGLGGSSWPKGRRKRDRYHAIRDQNWSLAKVAIEQQQQRREFFAQPALANRAEEQEETGEIPDQRQQLATNKLASIIMTPTRVGPDLGACCRLDLESRGCGDGCGWHWRSTGDERGRGGNGSSSTDNNGNNNRNKSNIINNNNINNNNKHSRLLQAVGADQKEAAPQNGNCAPARMDCPETMSCTSAVEIATTDHRRRRKQPSNLGPTTKTVYHRVEQEARCLIRNALTISGKRRSILASCWSLTLLILIAYELYVKVRSSTAANRIPCQKCLPDVVFIRTCSAQELSTDVTNHSESVATQKPELMRMAPISSPLVNATATKTDSILPATVEANFNNNEIITMRPTINSNAINRHHGAHNVLCNSRCNCVILEPLAGPAEFGGSQRQENLSQESSPQPPGGNSSLLPAATTMSPQQAKPPAPNPMQSPSLNDSNFQLQQHQRQLEQALIAFNEDYSLDSEQPAATGSASDDAGAADMVEPALAQAGGPVAAAGQAAAGLLAGGGNDRTPSRPADQSSAMPEAVSSGAVRVGTSSNNIAENSTANNNNATNSSPEKLAGLLQVNQSDNSGSTTNASSTNETNLRHPAPDARVVGGAGNSRHWQLSQQPNATAKSNHVAAGRLQQQPPPSQEPGMTLFPLPAHLHHRHHHYQPLGPGSGRESSGPQLYAQSLYSSQAPKLSYHAHTPYLKSSGVVGQQQQLSQQSELMAAGLPPSGAASAGPAGSALMTTTPVGHHHMRSPHHLRGQPGAGSVKLLAGVALNLGSIQRLAPLRTLDLSSRLSDWNKTVATLGQADSTSNDSSGGSKSAAGHWSESSQFADRIKVILDEISQQDVQSLVLRDNNIQFELWSELYALLAPSMRQNLFHLDMSHNGLAKLGITFTGYIEHHLAAHGSWPFSGNGAQTTSSGPSGGSNNNNQTQSSLSHINEIGAGNQQPSRVSSKTQGAGRMRHNLLSGGRLYTQVQRLMLASLSFNRNLSNSTSANSSSSNSTTILLQQPMLLRALDLSHNKLKWLINDQFKALKHVQTIRLDYNRIRYINQHAFSGLESLRFLNLNFNRLQVIYIEQFQTNYNLLALMLRSNYLAYLRGGSFASLANLRRLDLSRNKLTIMSNNAFVGLESLEILNCSSNQFVHTPSASLHPLTSLRQLDLSDNLITQLTPGTFFHLPIEELWLSQNEQLVAIDRGAFWDLPYLRRLHLKWNPMLMGINSQAFVGTQSLHSIDVEGCQSLESGARQMLENITMAATSRLLRYEQSRLNHTSQTDDSTGGSSLGNHQLSSNMTATLTMPLELSIAANHSKQNSSFTPSTSHHIKRILEQPGSRGQLVKYSYCLAIVCLLVVALKLVFKFTSTSHYLEARRRRRRVYMTKGDMASGHSVELGDDGQSMSSCSGQDNYPMCVQPDNHVIAAIVGAGRRSTQSPVGHYNQDDGQVLRVSQQEAPMEEDGVQNDMASGDANENNDISVISDSAYCLGWPTNYSEEAAAAADAGNEPSLCCNEPGSSALPVATSAARVESHETSIPLPEEQQQPQRSNSTIDLIHSQLIAAGFDYGHANCAHFYQSLGPALQLADITASFVNNMDYY